MPGKSKLDKHAAKRVIDLQKMIDDIKKLDLVILSNKLDTIASILGVTFNVNGTLLSETHSTEINTLASILGVTFSVDKTLLSETYTAHKHNYFDATITDTADGTGVSSDAARQTQGVI